MRVLKWIFSISLVTMLFCEAYANREVIVNAQDGNPLFIFNILDEGERYGDEEGEVAAFNLSDNWQMVLEAAGNYYASIFGSSLPSRRSPSIISVIGGDGFHMEPKFRENDYKTFLASALQETLEGCSRLSHTELFIGRDWEDVVIEKPSVLPCSRALCKAFSITIHELGHGFGITEKGHNFLSHYQSCAILSPYMSFLVDSFGNRMSPSMNVVESSVAVSEKFAIFLSEYEMIGKIGFAFFQGPSVMSTLRENFLPFNNPNRIIGLPILALTWQGPHLNHSGLRNSVMSTWAYRNHSVFMELELAMLKDIIGLPIDIRNLYGWSIYGDGQEHILNEDHSFSERVQQRPEEYVYGPESSTTSLAIGLHVYGSTNSIQMIAGYKVLQSGAGSVGVRVDGWDNALSLTEEAKISSDGENGTGIMVCYGRDHNIIQHGTITVRGNGGIAVRFDFGENLCDEIKELRGSYIHEGINIKAILARTRSRQDTRDTVQEEDEGLDSFSVCHLDLLPELQGPLVKRFSVLGRAHLEGKAAAIFISRNAYVDEVVVGGQSDILGNIASYWNPLADFVQRPADMELHTRLRFGTCIDAEDAVVADAEYRGTFRGEIEDRGKALEVSLEGGVLEYHGSHMTGLAKFHMCARATLQIAKSLCIKAEKVLFEAGATIVLHSTLAEPIFLEVESNEDVDASHIMSNIFRKSDVVERVSVSCNVERTETVDESDEAHPKRRFNFKFSFVECDIVV